ncbi:hypothetical protein [Aquabacterium sp.]|uniref:hypothetical protein n=1 Tax=Aquabacterium sp. TaxID=1872578 RepID=UPI002CC6414A|nr:hypothetical protein [Aquabacterium sp.]HSW04747.1 hypothetical protein [Aquabacterium sp.]
MSSADTDRIERWVWILIYGGLLVLVLGVAVEDLNFALGWSMVTGGGGAAVAGVVLIFIRSRMKA